MKDVELYSSLNLAGRKTEKEKAENQWHPSRALHVKLCETPRSESSPQLWKTRNLIEQSWFDLLNLISNLLISFFLSTKNMLIELLDGTDICIKHSLAMRNTDSSFLIDPHTWTPFKPITSMNKLYFPSRVCKHLIRSLWLDLVFPNNIF